MYQNIYNFFVDLFNNSTLSSMSSQIMGVTINFNEWLCHSMTIISLILMFVVLCLIAKWLFKVFSGIVLIR